jgi:hypothetical protein
MKLIITALAAIFLLNPSISSANDADLTSHSKCSARAIDRFYCPAPGGWWYGPYFDNGCRVKCEEGQKAVCQEATCEDNQSGMSVPSSCSCE